MPMAGSGAITRDCSTRTFWSVFCLGFDVGDVYDVYDVHGVGVICMMFI